MHHIAIFCDKQVDAQTRDLCNTKEKTVWQETYSTFHCFLCHIIYRDEKMVYLPWTHGSPKLQYHHINSRGWVISGTRSIL